MFPFLNSSVLVSLGLYPNETVVENGIVKMLSTTTESIKIYMGDSGVLPLAKISIGSLTWRGDGFLKYISVPSHDMLPAIIDSCSHDDARNNNENKRNSFISFAFI